ncbi:MAG: S1 RNA-binding domain-containing protein [Dehalococcoidia bacterium]
MEQSEATDSKSQDLSADYGMQQLLDESESVRSIKRGDVISGVVVQKDREGLLVDIGAKTEGMVPSREMRTLEPDDLEGMKVGDQVLVYVLQTSEREDQIHLSVDRAQGEKGWHTLQQYFEKEVIIEGEAVDFNKGGLLVNVEGVRGFVPMSQLASLTSFGPPTDDPSQSPLAGLVGHQLRLKVIEINRRRNRLILSERQVLREEREQQRGKVFAEIQEGEVRKGRVTGIREFGAFVDIGGIDGLVHISEFSWGQTEPPEKCVSIGDEVDTYVLKVDHETKKIALSFRRLHPEPWETIHDKYHVEQLVKGTVTKVTTFGAFARLDPAIEGLIHVSELSDAPIRHPGDVVNEGDVLTLKILRIEPDRHRLALSLKQAQGMSLELPEEPEELESSDADEAQEEGASIEDEPDEGDGG